jgi:transcriptional repressor NrdR
MYCPFCGHVETKVNDSRLAAEGRQIRRRRECLACGERFTTFESAELVMPLVVKSDQTREPYDARKLRSGLLKALEKRPVGHEAVEEAVSRIEHRLRGLGEREVESRVIGELVMEELRHLDEVAYVRFASVYRHFQDIEAFRDEIERLRHRRRREPVEGQLSLLAGEATEPPGTVRAVAAPAGRSKRARGAAGEPAAAAGDPTASGAVRKP